MKKSYLLVLAFAFCLFGSLSVAAQDFSRTYDFTIPEGSVDVQKKADMIQQGFDDAVLTYQKAQKVKKGEEPEPVELTEEDRTKVIDKIFGNNREDLVVACKYLIEKQEYGPAAAIIALLKQREGAYAYTMLLDAYYGFCHGDTEAQKGELSVAADNYGLVTTNFHELEDYLQGDTAQLINLRLITADANERLNPYGAIENLTDILKLHPSSADSTDIYARIARLEHGNGHYVTSLDNYIKYLNRTPQLEANAYNAQIVEDYIDVLQRVQDFRLKKLNGGYVADTLIKAEEPHYDLLAKECEKYLEFHPRSLAIKRSNFTANLAMFYDGTDKQYRSDHYNDILTKAAYIVNKEYADSLYNCLDYYRMSKLALYQEDEQQGKNDYIDYLFKTVELYESNLMTDSIDAIQKELIGVLQQEERFGDVAKVREAMYAYQAKVFESEGKAFDKYTSYYNQASDNYNALLAGRDRLSIEEKEHFFARADSLYRLAFEETVTVDSLASKQTRVLNLLCNTYTNLIQMLDMPEDSLRVLYYDKGMAYFGGVHTRLGDEHRAGQVAKSKQGNLVRAMLRASKSQQERDKYFDLAVNSIGDQIRGTDDEDAKIEYIESSMDAYQNAMANGGSDSLAVVYIDQANKFYTQLMKEESAKDECSEVVNNLLLAQYQLYASWLEFTQDTALVRQHADKIFTEWENLNETNPMVCYHHGNALVQNPGNAGMPDASIEAGYYELAEARFSMGQISDQNKENILVWLMLYSYFQYQNAVSAKDQEAKLKYDEAVGDYILKVYKVDPYQPQALALNDGWMVIPTTKKKKR